jgi:hypothetical protein
METDADLKNTLKLKTFFFLALDVLDDVFIQWRTTTRGVVI